MNTENRCERLCNSDSAGALVECGNPARATVYYHDETSWRACWRCASEIEERHGSEVEWDEEAS